MALDQAHQVSQDERNPFFAGSLIQTLLTTYMGILPLWSGICLRGVTRETNSHVENWNRILKVGLLERKRKDLSDFVSDVGSTLESR